MAENDDFFDDSFEYFDQKELDGKFLAHVKPEDLDEFGRFICKEPVLIIGSHAFEDVKDKLTYVRIFGVLSIENEAFADCQFLKLADIDFELDFRYPQNYDLHMFWKNQVINSEEDYENAVNKFCSRCGKYSVHIKDGAFNNCRSLQKFHFPSRAVLHGSPFRFCENLKEVTFDGSVSIRYSPKQIEELEYGQLPFRGITFKDCDHIEKMNFEECDGIKLEQIASFYSLKEINLNCNAFDRRRFWKNAVCSYPEMLLILPTYLYNDEKFLQGCLPAATDAMYELYGAKEGYHIFAELLRTKHKIEKCKAKERRKAKSQETNLKAQDKILQDISLRSK